MVLWGNLSQVIFPALYTCLFSALHMYQLKMAIRILFLLLEKLDYAHIFAHNPKFHFCGPKTLTFAHSPNMAARAFWARISPNIHFVDFRAYLGHFSLVKIKVRSPYQKQSFWGKTFSPWFS